MCVPEQHPIRQLHASNIMSGFKFHEYNKCPASFYEPAESVKPSAECHEATSNSQPVKSVRPDVLNLSFSFINRCHVSSLEKPLDLFLVQILSALLPLDALACSTDKAFHLEPSPAF